MSSSYNLRNRQISTEKNSSLLNNGLLNHKESHINKDGHLNGLINRENRQSKDDFTGNTVSRPAMQLNSEEKEEVQSLVLWRRPFKTIYHFLRNVIYLLNNWCTWILNHFAICIILTVSVVFFVILLQLDPIKQQPIIQYLNKRIIWCLYWCGLGVLSSVGLGTGLHTFILYLGPHIASVTLAAYECNSVDFPEPPYPDQIICPSNSTTNPNGSEITVWTIMSKVRLEAFMWGAGTALGELPPYFISRAHRLAAIHGGNDTEPDETLEEIQDLVPELSDGDQQQRATAVSNNVFDSFFRATKSKLILLIKKMGFFGILACASIPNPLFDLAGLICGYSLVSFWTFFGATLLGKAVIKMHLQKLLVIIVFNETYVQTVLSFCKNIPYIGHYIHNSLRNYLQQQKENLHIRSHQTSSSLISTIFDAFIFVMVLYFIISIIESMAQEDLKRCYLNKKMKSFKDVGDVTGNELDEQSRPRKSKSNNLPKKFE